MVKNILCPVISFETMSCNFQLSKISQNISLNLIKHEPQKISFLIFIKLKNKMITLIESCQLFARYLMTWEFCNSGITRHHLKFLLYFQDCLCKDIKSLVDLGLSHVKGWNQTDGLVPVATGV